MSKLGFRHLSLRIDPALSCNLRCKMCYFSNTEYRKTSKGSFSATNMEDIAKIFYPKALQVVLGCGAEPTINTNFMTMLELAAKYQVPNISLVTNGMLLRESQIRKMHKIGVDEIILSAHGLTSNSYESFMTNGHFEKFITLLDKISQLNCNSDKLRIRINFTANNENINDLMLFPEFMDRFNISTIQIRPIMDIGGKYRTPIHENQIDTYNSSIRFLKIECEKRNIILLANTTDVTYKEANQDSNLIESIYTYISPKTIEQYSIGTKTNSLKKYKKQVQWTRNLLSGLAKPNNRNNYLARTLKYDIH
ncbi:MAG: radical SAM protein [Carboxylicivirga sp.]|nr:radical SAM protein [Carboxylicivirga sp.]